MGDSHLQPDSTKGGGKGSKKMGSMELGTNGAMDRLEVCARRDNQDTERTTDDAGESKRCMEGHQKRHIGERQRKLKSHRKKEEVPVDDDEEMGKWRRNDEADTLVVKAANEAAVSAVTRKLYKEEFKKEKD